LEIKFATKLPGQQARGIIPASYDNWGIRCVCPDACGVPLDTGGGALHVAGFPAGFGLL